MWDDLTRAAQAAKLRPAAWLEQSRIYGDLARSEPFATAFCNWLPLIWSQGCEAALREYAK